MCRVVDTVLIDQETVYAPRRGNDRLLLGLKGSLNEYELDLLRQRSLAARYGKRAVATSWSVAGRVRQGRRSLREGSGSARPSGDHAGLRQGAGTRQRSSGLVVELRARPRPARQEQGRSHGVTSQLCHHRMIENPIYGGAYAYGKTAVAANYGTLAVGVRWRRKARADGLALIPNAHEGYVSWENAEAIRKMVRDNVPTSRHHGAPSMAMR